MAPLSVPAQAVRPLESQLDSLVPALMQETGARGVAVAIIERGRIAVQRTYGFADLERREPVSLKTTFNAASVTKSLTAWAVMQLVEKGRISLDDPVSRHVTRWTLPASQFPVEQVTIRRLLSHTAGINRGSTGIWQRGETLPTLEAAMSGNNNGYGETQLQQMPGAAFSYSGGGYSILQLLIEQASGHRYADYISANVLRPLGLMESAIGWPERIMARYATSYSELGVPLPGYRTIEEATGALNVTIGDLARFAAAHTGPRAGGGVLKPTTIQQMMAPAPEAQGRYGLGLSIERTADGRTYIGHDGGNPGWGAAFRVEPSTGNGIAILTNRSWGYELYYQVLCAWRNSTAAVGNSERCQKSPIALLSTALVERGLMAAKQLFRDMRQSNPAAMPTARMRELSRRLMNNGRQADAVEVMRWNAESQPTVASAHEALGDVQLAIGDTVSARASFTESSRLAPENRAIRAKLDSLAIARPPR